MNMGSSDTWARTSPESTGESMSTLPSSTNILFITSDQQRADCYGFAGRRVRTPHLDRLAAAGTRFDACITPNLVCQPSRASMLTGMLPLTHGVIDNGIDLPEDTGRSGFAGALAARGYDTAFIGKAHFATARTYAPTGTAECLRSSQSFPPTWRGPYMGFEHVELTCLGHLFPDSPPTDPLQGRHYEHWLYSQGIPSEVFQMWKTPTRRTTGAAQTWVSALPQSWHTSEWCANRAIDYLRTAGRERPFCMWVSFPDPHHPFDCPEPWARLHHPDEVELPRVPHKDLDVRPWWHRASLESPPAGGDEASRRFRSTLSRTPDQTEAQLRDMTANYYGMISLIDHSVGRILTALHQSGLDERTLVVYSTDHGDLLGDHGLYLKGPTPYESLLRVGLLMRGPGIPEGGVVADPVSTLDLAATFADVAGTTLDQAAQSRSLLPVVAGKESREVAYSEWHVNESRCGVPLELHTVRGQGWKCTVEKRSGAGELYDLREDPDEMRNLFDDPAGAVLRRQAEALIEARPGKRRAEKLPVVGMA